VWVLGAVERTTDGVERGLPAEDACLGLVGLSDGATILIQGNLVRGLGQGCRVIGSDGVMELDTTRPPDDQIPSDTPMYMPEGPSARYNAEIGTVRYFSAATSGWKHVEAPWHDSWAHQCEEAIDWVEGRVEQPISRAERGRAVQEIMMALYESARKKQRIYLPLKTRVNPLRLMVEQGDLPVEWPGTYESRARIVRGEGMSWSNDLN
jgi:predicted dehydrogenase